MQDEAWETILSMSDDSDSLGVWAIGWHRRSLHCVKDSGHRQGTDGWPSYYHEASVLKTWLENALL